MQGKTILRAAKRVMLLPNRETLVPTATYLQLSDDEMAVFAGLEGATDTVRVYRKWEPGFCGVAEITMLNTGREAVFVEKWQELGTLVKVQRGAGDRE